MAIGGVDGFRHIDDIVGELLVLRIEGAVGVAHGVVADDDWMDAVTAVPVRIPLFEWCEGCAAVLGAAFGGVVVGHRTALAVASVGETVGRHAT